MEQDGQPSRFRRSKDGVVLAVAPEWIDPGCRQVDGDNPLLPGIALDLAGTVFGILRTGQQSAVQSWLVGQPGLHQPPVVGVAQLCGVVDLRQRSEEQTVVWKEDANVDGERRELFA